MVWSEGRSGSDIIHRAMVGPGHISVISLVGGLWVRTDRCRAAGAAPVCCGATPVDGAVGCMGVLAVALLGVLIFAVGTAGSGTDAGATDAVDVTAGCECAGGAPGHSGVAGATLPGEELSCVGFCFFTASRCLSRMWSRACRYVPPPTTLIR